MKKEGEMINDNCQMTKSKWRNLWESGKTSSERKGIRETDQKTLKRRDNGVTLFGDPEVDLPILQDPAEIAFLHG